MKALLVGYGKMGKEIEAALLARGHSIVDRIDPAPHAATPDTHLSKKGLSSDLPVCDVAFEFTVPLAAQQNVLACLSRRIPVVSGTTGWDVAPAVRFAREQKVPFLHSPNFSIAVAALRRAVTTATEILAAFPEFEPGILERHHSAKKDAPSGTAKLLAAAMDRARPGRPSVPVVSLRQGGQPGEHVVFFEGANESLELVHRARSRALFAAGAVHAAEWLLSSSRTGPVTFDDFLDAARSST